MFFLFVVLYVVLLNLRESLEFMGFRFSICYLWGLGNVLLVFFVCFLCFVFRCIIFFEMRIWMSVIYELIFCNVFWIEW